MTPLPPDSDVSVETWLAKTNYPEWRKQSLRRTWEKHRDSLYPGSPDWKKIIRCKSFQKAETYPEPKHGRGINARSDPLKCKVGPIFKLIEEALFARPEFIKHVPVADRPRVISETLDMPGMVLLVTDYQAFESLFIAVLMCVCEFQLYSYMTGAMPCHGWFMDFCHDVLAGGNECSFKTFRVYNLFARMSGEMSTSLGNSFLNLMAFLFFCHEKGSKGRGHVEGDDGIFGVIGKSPTTEDFASLGLRIKLDVVPSLSRASFCGILFHPDDKINVTDPRKLLATFGWTNERYARAKPVMLKRLLRAKSLSMAYQYPGCPVASSLAQYGLRATRFIGIRKFVKESRLLSSWDRERYLAAIRDEANIRVVPTPMATRLLVEELYNFPVSSQLAVERYLDGLSRIQPLMIDVDVCGFTPDQQEYYHNYIVRGTRTDRALEYPGQRWPYLEGWVQEWEWVGPTKIRPTPGTLAAA